jgi:hypothetical protein
MNLPVFLSLSLLVVGIAGCSTPDVPKVQWRQQVMTDIDTCFPGIKLGMTQKEVRSKIPSEYRLTDSQAFIISQTPGLAKLADPSGPGTRYLRIERVHKTEGLYEIDHFVFVDDRLTNTTAGYGRTY